MNEEYMCNKQEKLILTTQEVAAWLGLSDNEVRRLADEKHLKPLRGFRKPRKFSRYVIMDYLKGEK